MRKDANTEAYSGNDDGSQCVVDGDHNGLLCGRQVDEYCVKRNVENVVVVNSVTETPK